MQPLLVAFNRYIERLRLMVARQSCADASHQLRTPLAVLKTQVVALASDRPQQRESLQAMSTTLDNTVALTDRLLHLSRLKASEHRAERQLHPVNLAQVLRDACFSRPQARSKQIDPGLKARRRAVWRGSRCCWPNCAPTCWTTLKYTPRRGVVTARLTQDQASGEGVLRLKTAARHSLAGQGAGAAVSSAGQRGRSAGRWPGLALVKDITVSRHPPGAAELRRAGRPVGGCVSGRCLKPVLCRIRRRPPGLCLRVSGRSRCDRITPSRVMPPPIRW